MRTEKYPFLPDVVFVLIGAFFATLGMTHPNADAKTQTPAASSEPGASRSDKSLVDAITYLRPDGIPENAIPLVLNRTADDIAFSLGEREGLDGKELGARLAKIGELKPGTPIRLVAVGDVDYGDLLRVADLCKGLGLFPFVVAEQK